MAPRPQSAEAVASAYEAQRDAHDLAAGRATARADRLGNLRLLAFAAALGVAIGAWAGTLSMFWALLPLAGFAILVTRSAQADAARLKAERARDWFEDGLARLGTSWPGRGDDGVRFKDATHPYADDLDLFGEGSLFERIARTRTGAGGQVLAGMLTTAPRDLETVKEAQAAVQELTPALAFRERLSRVAAEAHRGTRVAPLQTWIEREPHEVPAWERIAWMLTSAVSTITVVGWLFGPWNAGPAALALLLQYLVLRKSSRWIVDSLQSGMAAAGELSLLRRLIETIGAEAFAAKRLQAAQSALRDGARPPTDVLQQLERRVAYVESLANMFFLPFALLLGLPAHLAVAIESWRRKYGASCVAWSQAVADVEALASLAS